MRFFPLDDPVHQEVAELLPWFANGTLVGRERVDVNRHVSECIACWRGLEDLRALQSAIRNDHVDSAATQAFAQLKTRIEQDESKRPRHVLYRVAFRWTAPGQPDAPALSSRTGDPSAGMKASAASATD